MGFVVAAGGLIALWAWATGRLRSLAASDFVAGVAAIAGAELLLKGSWAMGGVAFGGAVLWFAGGRRAAGVSRPPIVPFAPTMPLDEARALLGLPPGADAAAIRAAHRRLILRVHPDAGGSQELSRQVNTARDALLAELRTR